MRLTLRTLLAYTDDVLDSADHEELGKKIEASDFATELIHRTRDTVRRLRLGAPAVLADGGDGVLDSICISDANAVAEYLDNTLAPEDVADFERICLEPGNEADMHLAEVASCHHVLTMVLGEPAEIAGDLRRRMYELPANLVAGKKLRVEPAHTPPQQVAPAPAAPPVVRSPESDEVEVPDYLREAARANRRGLRTAMTAALLLVAAGVGYFAFSPVEQPSVPSGVVEEDLAGVEGDLEIGGVDTKFGDATGEVADSGGEAQPFVPGAVAEAPAFQPGVGEDKPAESTELTAETPEVAQEDSETRVATLALDSEIPEGSELVAPTEAAAMTEEPAAEAVEVTPRMALMPKTQDDTPIDVQEIAAEPAGPTQLGSYLGNNDVLLRRVGEMDPWVRLPPRSAILAGEQLLTLPTFRTHVVLADVNTYLSGGTHVVLPMEEETIEGGEVALRMTVVYGKVLFNAGLNGGRVAFYSDDTPRLFRLSSSASLAVEVRRIFVPGNDNETQSSPVEVVWYLTTGSVDWPGVSGETQSIQSPVTWTTVGGIDDLPQAIEVLPEWVDREPMTDMQRRARTVLVEELELGEPVRLRLLELSDQAGKGRQREVRTLAAEASVYIGEFEPFVKALSDKDQRRTWVRHIDTLRRALALSPDAAARVHKAFVDLRGEAAGGDLIEMVAGYSRDQIGRTSEARQEGALPKLVRWLESDSLDYRVLAIHNLDEISGIEGTATLKGFLPAGPPRQRKVAIAKIRKSFESDELLASP